MEIETQFKSMKRKADAIPVATKRNLVAVHSHIYEIPTGYHEVVPELFKEINTLQDLISIGKAFIQLIKICETLPMIQLWTELTWTQISIFVRISRVTAEIALLDQMVGLTDLKEHFLRQMMYLLSNIDVNHPYLHTLILGPPGHGKTEVARLIGKIYAKSGILSSNKFVSVNRADLVGMYCGHTAPKTTAVYESAKGGVLYIDEIYSLGNPEQRDTFTRECIDTLTHLMDTDRTTMVIGSGYEKETHERFLAYNPGLTRRIPWIFVIQPYDGDDLLQIFMKLLHEDQWSLDSSDVIDADLFTKNREIFTNAGGDVLNFINCCKIAHYSRTFRQLPSRSLNHTDIEVALITFQTHRTKSSNIRPVTPPPAGMYT